MSQQVDEPQRDPALIATWDKAPHDNPNDVGADWRPRLQATGIGAARRLNDFLGSNSPSDRRQQDQEFDRVKQAWAVKGFDADVENLNPIGED